MQKRVIYYEGPAGVRSMPRPVLEDVSDEHEYREKL
jgi:hypothetical protein